MLSCSVLRVLSPNLFFVCNSNSIWQKIMERRLAVDVAAVDNSNDSGCNWKPSISEQRHITLLALDWTQGNAQMGNMGNNCFMWRQIWLSLLSISLSHSLPPPPSFPKWWMQMQSYSSTYWSSWINATALIREMYSQGNGPHLKWNAFNLCAVVFSGTFFFVHFALIVKSLSFSEIRYCKRWQLREQNWQAWQRQWWKRCAWNTKRGGKRKEKKRWYLLNVICIPFHLITNQLCIWAT